MTEWIDDRPEKEDENKLERIEELAHRYGKKANEYICNIILGEAIQESYNIGKRAGQKEKAQAEWVVEEIKIAYDRGFKEGQQSALTSIEGANKKIYEG